MKLFKALFLFLFLGLSLFVFSQNKKDKVKNGYTFTDKIRIKDTPVKNQQRSGTCWSFAATSFLETELLRTTGQVYDIAEMYFVRLMYQEKAKKYVRLQGKANFSQGGQAHDVFNCISKYGLVPENEYTGLEYGEKIHNHNEVEAVLKSMLDVYVSNPNKKLSTAWYKSIVSVLDNYFGIIPGKFNYNDKEFTTLAFSKSLNINVSDYIVAP